MVGGGDTGGYAPHEGGGGVVDGAALSFKQISVNGKSACKALFRLCARRGQQKPTINGNLLKKDSAANRLATVMANTPHGRGRGEILPLGRVGRGAGNCPCLSLVLQDVFGPLFCNGLCKLWKRSAAIFPPRT